MRKPTTPIDACDLRDGCVILGNKNCLYQVVEHIRLREEIMLHLVNLDTLQWRRRRDLSISRVKNETTVRLVSNRPQIDTRTYPHMPLFSDREIREMSDGKGNE